MKPWDENFRNSPPRSLLIYLPLPHLIPLLSCYSTKEAHLPAGQPLYLDAISSCLPKGPHTVKIVLSSVFLASPSLWCLSLVHVTSTCLRLSSFSLYPNLSPVPRHTRDFHISLVYLDTQIPSWTNIFIYYVFDSWINIFIYYSFASLSISFHLNVNSTGARLIVHLFPEASQSLRPAIDKYQGMNKYFLKWTDENWYPDVY